MKNRARMITARSGSRRKPIDIRRGRGPSIGSMRSTRAMGRTRRPTRWWDRGTVESASIRKTAEPGIEGSRRMARPGRLPSPIARAERDHVLDAWDVPLSMTPCPGHGNNGHVEVPSSPSRRKGGRESALDWASWDRRGESG